MLTVMERCLPLASKRAAARISRSRSAAFNRAGGVRLRHGDHELLAAPTAEQVAGTQGRETGLRQHSNGGVACPRDRTGRSPA